MKVGVSEYVPVSAFFSRSISYITLDLDLFSVSKQHIFLIESNDIHILFNLRTEALSPVVR